MDVTKDTIRLAYLLFLDRNPSEAEVDAMADSDITLDRLRNVFLNSREFDRGFMARRAQGGFSEAKDRAMIHLHVPKTAGSSLTRILAPNFARGTQLPVSDGQLGEFVNTPEEYRRAASFVFGHLSHGVAEYLPQGHKYICVLRKPGPRLLSYYKYLHRTTDHPSYEAVGGQDMSFGTFLEWALDHANGHRNEVNNGQIRRLAGLHMQHSGANEAQMLPEALKNITAPDMSYGLTEHFDHFIHRLHAEGIIANTSDTRVNAAEHPASLEEALEHMTPYQRELYDSFTGWDDIFYNICEQLYFAKDDHAAQPVAVP